MPSSTKTPVSRSWVAYLLLPALLALACNLPGSPALTTTSPTSVPPTADPDILYQDSFTDPESGWPTLVTDTARSGYHPPDAYHLEVSAPNTFAWRFRDQDFSDFSAEAVVFADILGDPGLWRHGLTFRQVSEAQFYAFVINPRAQSWHVLKRAGDAWQTLGEGSDPGIAFELKAVNTLRVDAQGPNMSFSINGRQVATAGDAEFAAGDFGFVVETFDQSLAHIHFDSLVVRRFDPNAILPVLTAIPTPATATPTPTATETPTPSVTPGGAFTPAGSGADFQTSIAGTVAALALTAAAGGAGTAFAGTATSFFETAAAAATEFAPIVTLACGLPGLPPCP